MILWVDASNEDSTLLSFRTIAQVFLEAVERDISSDQDAKSSLLSRLSVAPWLREPGELPLDSITLRKVAASVIRLLEGEDETFTWLLIMENLDDLDNYPLETYLPRQEQRGRVIITTRLAPVARFGVAIEVGEIEEEGAIRILLDTAGLSTTSGKGNANIKPLSA